MSRQDNNVSTTVQDAKVPSRPMISHNVDDYEVIEDIGRGQFGVVQKIRFKTQLDTFLVWKKIRYCQMSDREKKQLTQEVKLLQALSHSNVVRYVGKINEKKTAVLYLLMEYCDGGDLGRYLEHTVKKGHFLPEELILNWFRQLVDALFYCHSRAEGKVLHRDLKPQNILLTGKFKKLKLADFGLAKMLQPTQIMAQTHVGTPYYMSPEVLSRFQYDEKSDIWSFGCLIFEMATGISPFNRAKSYDDLVRLVDSGNILDDFDLPDFYAPELFGTVKWMLTKDPNKRPTATQLRSSTLYKWASALRHVDLSNCLREAVREQQAVIERQTSEIDSLRSSLRKLDRDFQFIEEYVLFHVESDETIRRSLRLVTAGLETTARAQFQQRESPRSRTDYPHHPSNMPQPNNPSRQVTIPSTQ